MNLLDLIIAIPLLWFGYKGFTKGFIIEAASLAALVAGIYAGFYFSWFIAKYIREWFNTDSQNVPLIAFSVTFLGVVILVFLLARTLDKVIKKAALSLPNRIAGALLSALKVLLILGTIILLMNRYDHEKNVIKSEIREGSLLYGPIEKMTLTIYPMISEKLDFDNIPQPLKEVETTNTNTSE